MAPKSAVKDPSNDVLCIFVGYIVSEIFVENLKLLTQIIHGIEALLYTKNIYPVPYIPHTGQIRVKYNICVYSTTLVVKTFRI